MYGLSENTILKVQKVLASYEQVESARIFGSRAKGNQKNASDIDLVLFGQKLEIDTLLKLENDIDDLLLPYTVDLLLWNFLDNEALKEHIQRVGQIFFEQKTGATK